MLDLRNSLFTVTQMFYLCYVFPTDDVLAIESYLYSEGVADYPETGLLRRIHTACQRMESFHEFIVYVQYTCLRRRKYCVVQNGAKWLWLLLLPRQEISLHGSHQIGT